MDGWESGMRERRGGRAEWMGKGMREGEREEWAGIHRWRSGMRERGGVTAGWMLEWDEGERAGLD